MRKTFWDSFADGQRAMAPIVQAFKDYQVGQAAQSNQVQEGAAGREEAIKLGNQANEYDAAATGLDMSRFDSPEQYSAAQQAYTDAAATARDKAGLALSSGKNAFYVGDKSFDDQGSAQRFADSQNLRAMAEAYSKQGNPMEALKLKQMGQQMDLGALQISQAQRNEQKAQEEDLISNEIKSLQEGFYSTDPAKRNEALTKVLGGITNDPNSSATGGLVSGPDGKKYVALTQHTWDEKAGKPVQSTQYVDADKVSPDMFMQGLGQYARSRYSMLGADQLYKANADARGDRQVAATETTANAAMRNAATSEKYRADQAGYMRGMLGIHQQELGLKRSALNANQQKHDWVPAGEDNGVPVFLDRKNFNPANGTGLVRSDGKPVQDSLSIYRKFTGAANPATAKAPTEMSVADAQALSDHVAQAVASKAKGDANFAKLLKADPSAAQQQVIGELGQQYGKLGVRVRGLGLPQAPQSTEMKMPPGYGAAQPPESAPPVRQQGLLDRFIDSMDARAKQHAIDEEDRRSRLGL